MTAPSSWEWSGHGRAERDEVAVEVTSHEGDLIPRLGAKASMDRGALVPNLYEQCLDVIDLDPRPDWWAPDEPPF
jgi:hypothetical protein